MCAICKSFLSYSLNTHLKNPPPQAVRHRDLSASKRFFSGNTSSKSCGRRQPSRGFFPRLAKKIFLFEVLWQFCGEDFFLQQTPRAQQYLMYCKAEEEATGKKIAAKPNQSL
ncbi:MAG: hypothetical protein J6Q14_04635 [Oscillospiraceae bacterium]|nr:hypothetical protein [Oscillospiraceae bacterium]